MQLIINEFPFIPNQSKQSLGEQLAQGGGTDLTIGSVCCEASVSKISALCNNLSKPTMSGGRNAKSGDKIFAFTWVNSIKLYIAQTSLQQPW